MTKSKPTPSRPLPDPLDPLLAEWSSQCECSADQISTMWNRVSQSLASELHAQGENSDTTHPPMQQGFEWIKWVGKLSLAACLLIGLGLSFLKLRSPQQESPSQVLSVENSLAEFAFTPKELHEKQLLASEIQQLYVKPVLVRKTSSGWNIDEIPSPGNQVPSANTAMVIRCLLLESNATVRSSKETWTVIDEEEVIANSEYQHLADSDKAGDVEAWVHLLPDRSLWTECHDDTREEACVIMQNEPSVVWEEKVGDSVARRFIVVYQCLDIDDV